MKSRIEPDFLMEAWASCFDLASLASLASYINCSRFWPWQTQRGLGHPRNQAGFFTIQNEWIHNTITTVSKSWSIYDQNHGSNPWSLWSLSTGIYHHISLDHPEDPRVGETPKKNGLNCPLGITPLGINTFEALGYPLVLGCWPWLPGKPKTGVPQRLWLLL